MPLTYDDWKLATPPEYERERKVATECACCGEGMIDDVCRRCGWVDEDDADTLEEARGER